jgi:hypothetical protein
MARMYDDPFHHFELSADGTVFKCVHCTASYPRVPNDGAHYARPPIYQINQPDSADHKSTAVMQEKCPAKASRPAA